MFDCLCICTVFGAFHTEKEEYYSILLQKEKTSDPLRWFPLSEHERGMRSDRDPRETSHRWPWAVLHYSSTSHLIHSDHSIYTTTACFSTPKLCPGTSFGLFQLVLSWMLPFFLEEFQAHFIVFPVLDKRFNLRSQDFTDRFISEDMSVFIVKYIWH